jgi:hypothetical protein
MAYKEGYNFYDVHDDNNTNDDHCVPDPGYSFIFIRAFITIFFILDLKISYYRSLHHVVQIAVFLAVNQVINLSRNFLVSAPMKR